MRGISLRRFLLAFTVAVAAVASGVLIAGAATAPKPRELKVACAASSNGALRYVARASKCKRTEKAITIADSAPVDVCVRARKSRRVAAGSTRFVDAAAKCSRARSSKESALKVPGPKKLWFCALKKTGALRNVTARSRCSKKNDIALFVNKAKPVEQPTTPQGPPPNQAPTARDDGDSTGEDAGKAVAPLGNDSDPDGNVLAVASVDGTGTAGSVALSPDGTIAYDPNGAFEDLAPGDTETDSFTYRATDGSAQSGPATVRMTIEGANDAPEPQTSSGGTSYAEQDPPVAIDPGFTVSDVDDANLNGATVRVTGGFVANSDELLFTNASGITGTYDSGTGVLTLTGSATVAQYQAALRTVKFQTEGDGPSPNPRATEFRVRDADDQSAAVSRPLVVTGVNDAPFVNTTDAALQYDEGDSTPVDEQIDVGDPDSVNLEGATVTIDSPDPEDELLFTPQNGITTSGYDSGTGVLTLTGRATRAQYRQALRSVRFRNVDDTPTTGTRTVTFQVNDGSLDNAPANDERNVNVRAVNDAPVNTKVPGAQTTNEDVPEDFGAAPDFTIDDVDAGTDQVKTNVTASSGSVSVGPGDGSVDNIVNGVQIKGTVEEVNSRLDDVTYTPPPDVNGARTVTITTDDIGHNGSGGAKTDTDTVLVNLTSVNDAPFYQPVAGQTTPEDTPKTIDDLGVGDIDAGNSPLQTHLEVDHGTVTLATTSGLTFTVGDGTSDTGMTFTGSSAAISAALDGLTYTPNGNFNGSDSLDLSTSDQGATGDVGGTQTTPLSVGITVTAVNDAPVVHTNDGTSGWVEDNPPIFVDNALTVTDVENDSISGGTARITSGYANQDSPADHDTLDCQPAHGITCTWDAATGTLTLAGTATTAEYQDVLQTVFFDNDSENPSTADRTVTFKLTDTGPGTPTGTGADRTFSVTRNDDAPVAVGDSRTVAEDSGATAIDVLTNDTDVDAGPKVITAVTQPAHGTVTPTGGVSGANTGLTYRPNDDYCSSGEGPDTFTYTLNGGSTATVSVTVTCADDAPVAVNDSEQVGEDSPAITFDVVANDTDIDNGPKQVESTSDPAHGTVAITNSGADLTYTPDPNYCNSQSGDTRDTFTYTLNGGSTTTVSVSVVCVDDAPVAVGDAKTVTEDDPATTISVLGNDQDVDGGAIAIESATDPAHGTVSVAGDGSSLDYTPDANYCNTQSGGTPDTFSYELEPGTSSATVSVTVTCVPEPPVLAQPDGALSYTENAGEVAVAPNLTVSDPDDANLQSGSVQITAGLHSGEDHLLFTTQNGITATGSGTGSLTLSGSASVANWQTALRSVRYQNSSEDPSEDTRTVSFQVSDGESPSNAATRDIEVHAVNDAPVADNETFEDTNRAVGNTDLAVDDPTDGPPTIPNSTPTKFVTGDILAGDTDADGDSLSVIPGTTTTQNGGTADLQADGDFVYHPPVGCSVHEDSFEYQVWDGGFSGTGVGTVTVEVQDCVWYVASSAGTGGNGTSYAPFKTLNSLNGFDANVDGPGNTLYLAPGTYSGGLPLEDDQRLHTRRHGLTMPDGGTGTVTLDPALPAGPASQLNGGLVLADDNDVQGIVLGSAASNFALSGTSVGTAHVNDSTPGQINNPVGGAIGIGVSNPLDTNDVDIAMANVSSSGAGAEAINLVNVDGTVDLGTGTLQSAAATTVSLNGGDADFTYAGSVNDDDGTLIDIRNKTGGTNDFNGLVTNLPLDPPPPPPAPGDPSDPGDLGGGITLQGNDVAADGLSPSDSLTRFDGGITIGTGAANGITSTSGGQLAISGDHNTIETNNGGSALAIAFTPFHPDGVTFESITTKKANPGISLQATGSDAHLVVTGNAAGDAGSGGTIGTSVGRGVFLDTLPDGVELRHMNVTGGGDDGVRAIDVTDFSMTDSTVSNNGNATGERGFDFTNPAGTATLSGLTVGGKSDDAIRIEENATGGTHSGAALIEDSTITGPSSPSVGDSIDLQQIQSAQLRATVDGNSVTAPTGSGIRVGSDGVGSVRALVTGNAVSATAGQTGILFNQNDNSRLDATVKGNTVTGPAANAQTGLRAAGDDDGTICLDAGDSTDAAQKNSLTGSGGTGTDIVLVQQLQSRFLLPGYAGDRDDTAAVASYIKARNDAGGTPSAAATSASPPGYLDGTCLLP